MDASRESFNAKTVLVVDDDVSVLTVVKCMLETRDYNVLLASNAETALRIAGNADVAIHLLITDVIMPDTPGPELAERICTIRPDLNVLFMSGYIDSDVVRIKVLQHNLSFLPKPFTSDGLLETVERLLNAPCSRKFAAASEMLLHQ